MAARTWVLETQDTLEAHLGPKPSDGGRLEPEWDVYWPAYLACAHAAQAVRHVVGVINNTAGTTGSRMESPLQRHLRDAQQAATHTLISWRHYEDIGKTFVGHEPSRPPTWSCAAPDAGGRWQRRRRDRRRPAPVSSRTAFRDRRWAHGARRDHRTPE